MPSLTWKDTTSFSQGEKDRTPRCWTAKAGRVQIVVHRHIHFPPDAWLLSCAALRIDNRQLKSKDVDEAKQEAVRIVRELLEEAICEMAP
jgi:hypothetical protein